MNVPATETTRSEGIDVGNVIRAVMASQTEPVREDQEPQARPIRADTGPQSNIIESNEENVDIIPPAPISRAQLSLHADDTVLIDRPQEANVRNSGAESTRVRSLTIAGLSSIRPVERQMVRENRGREPPRTSTMNRRESSDSSDDERSRRERGRPPERDSYLGRDRRPPRRRPPDRGRPPEDGGRPPDRGGPPDDRG